LTYYDLALLEQHKYKYPIVLAKVGSQIHELADEVVNENLKIEFLATDNTIGMRAYQRSLIFLFLYAAHTLSPTYKTEVMFPLGNSVYIESEDPHFQHKLSDVEIFMHRIVKENHTITKQMIALPDAMKYFHDNDMNEKEELFSFRRVSSITLYKLNNFKNYFYGDLVRNTGVLSHFKITPFKNGALLCYPTHKNPNIIPNLAKYDKLYEKLYETAKWAKGLNAKTIGNLNNAIVDGRMDKIVLLQEAAMERNIANIAADIISNDKKFVLIAGPSSSGKTSFSNRLAVQLQTNGIKCHTIACDDYFRNRDEVPYDEHGEQNLESIDIVDLDQFDKDMTSLMNGERVEIPRFNFVIGKREYNGKHFIQLEENDMVIIEGIHCLNPRFLPSVNPYRIYISALTPLNIDEHNRISSSDLRMLRRMARDIRHRGTNPQNTIKSWNKVRAGEEENIFPYQENADVIFNSSLVYEVPMMKTIVEPLLFSVPKDSEEWVEAKRMLKFLDFFLAYPSNIVPRNSILQEFLGGSCFDVG
jgi:uridine kinase